MEVRDMSLTEIKKVYDEIKQRRGWKDREPDPYSEGYEDFPGPAAVGESGK